MGDWVFYLSVIKKDGLDNYHIPLLVFAIVSSVFAILTTVSYFLKNCSSAAKGTPAEKKITGLLTIFLSCEMIFEDLPQLIMTAMVLADIRGGFDGPSVFNLTTSLFNFVFNFLDMISPLPEKERSDDDDDYEGDMYHDDSAANQVAIE